MTYSPPDIAAPYAKVVWLDVLGTAVANTNWSTLARLTTAYLNTTKNSSGVSGDSIEWDVLLGAGTYTFDLFHMKDADVGIYTLSIDGVDKGTIDGYAAAPAASSLPAITGIVLATSGIKRVKLRMVTKNGASSAYFGRISGAKFTRTA